MDFDKSIDAAAVHMLKGKWDHILRLPGVMYLDCSTNLALQVRALYHVCIEIHPEGCTVLTSPQFHSGVTADFIADYDITLFSPNNYGHRSPSTGRKWTTDFIANCDVPLCSPILYR